MKKLFILGIALSLFISCAKEDNAGIPPVNQGQIPSQKQLTTLEADKATVADYVAGKKDCQRWEFLLFQILRWHFSSDICCHRCS